MLGSFGKISESHNVESSDDSMGLESSSEMIP